MENMLDQPRFDTGRCLCGLARATEQAAVTTLVALERLPIGVLLLDGDGQVGFVNGVARCLLERADGLCLRPLPGITGLGMLDVSSLLSRRAIDEAIREILPRAADGMSSVSRSVLVPCLSGRGSYVLQFSTLAASDQVGDDCTGYSAIVFVTESTSKPVTDPLALQNIYGLTRAEAAVAIALLEHDSAKEAARVLGVSPNTVRSQVKQIYVKLGVDNRSRFVRVMLGITSQHRQDGWRQSAR